MVWLWAKNILEQITKFKSYVKKWKQSIKDLKTICFK